MSDLYSLDELRRSAADLHLSGYLSRIVQSAAPVEPDLYVLRWGGLAESFYRCDKDEADGVLFDIDLFRDSDEDFQTSQGFDPEHDHFIVRAEVYEGMIDGLGPASDDVIDCLNELYPPCDECRDNDDV